MTNLAEGIISGDIKTHLQLIIGYQYKLKVVTESQFTKNYQNIFQMLHKN